MQFSTIRLEIVLKNEGCIAQITFTRKKVNEMTSQQARKERELNVAEWNLRNAVYMLVMALVIILLVLGIMYIISSPSLIASSLFIYVLRGKNFTAVLDNRRDIRTISKLLVNPQVSTSYEGNIVYLSLPE